MSTDSNTPVESTPEYQEDLDLFSKEFFGQDSSTPADKDEASPEAVNEEDSNDRNEDRDALENTNDVDDSDDDADQDDDTDLDEEQEAPKPKKNRFQERISELTRQAREAERAAQELEDKLKKYEQPETPVQQTKADNDSGPQADDLNEDGTEKYPLGEFDPSYIRDLTKFTLNEERKAIQQEEEQRKAEEADKAQKAQLTESWNNKLAPAQERYPDFHEKGEELNPVFESIDSKYGEYLAATIMDMDHGPDVLYYLANNVDEATRIVAMGPTKATIALGRIESKFADASEEKQKARPKISKAPTPPEHLNRGSAVAKTEVDDDTDDLEAFAKKFFKKPRRY